jgi:hypothetical protein
MSHRAAPYPLASSLPLRGRRGTVGAQGGAPNVAAPPRPGMGAGAGGEGNKELRLFRSVCGGTNWRVTGASSHWYVARD